jgi:hypothetical protein
MITSDVIGSHAHFHYYFNSKVKKANFLKDAVGARSPERSPFYPGCGKSKHERTSLHFECRKDEQKTAA